jgi:hypothetical protein
MALGLEDDELVKSIEEVAEVNMAEKRA